MAIVRLGDLDIDADMAFQRRSWIVQRIGWILMLALVLAAVLGVLGSGPLSHATTAIPGQLRVEYQRFTRYDDPETLVVRAEGAATTAGVVRLSLNRQYLDHSTVESVLPSPERVDAAAERTIFAFRVAEPGRPIEVGDDPIGIAVGRRAVWTANFRDGTLSRIALR